LDRGDVYVDCGPCRACCYQVVLLLDDEDGYEVDTIPTVMGPARILKRRPDGACVYLTAAGCGIHTDRPACCRVFHCGRWYETLPRAQRKDIARHGGDASKRMLREGKKRLMRDELHEAAREEERK